MSPPTGSYGVTFIYLFIHGLNQPRYQHKNTIIKMLNCVFFFFFFCQNCTPLAHCYICVTLMTIWPPMWLYLTRRGHHRPRTIRRQTKHLKAVPVPAERGYVNEGSVSTCSQIKLEKRDSLRKTVGAVIQTLRLLCVCQRSLLCLWEWKKAVCSGSH